MNSPVEIPGYDVWGRLGEGGMSEVWLAKHLGLCVPVVLKTLTSAIRASLGDSGATARVLTEARLMARVTSPRVVRAVDAGVTNAGVPFLVQEYVDGIDLAELDRRRRGSLGVGLPLWLVCVAMREICSALHAAHQAGVIHRDVKPSNIFGSPDGFRLGDFGIAVAHTRETRNEASGTLKFMAPEQLRGEHVDRFTDVWGAGATACDLRYGKTPFATVENILAHETKPHMPTPQTPEEAFFQHLLGIMLEKDTKKRLRSVADAGRLFGSLAHAIGESFSGGTIVDRNDLRLGPFVVTLAHGDIADAHADAIVSSANWEMRMRSGVGDALRRKGGDEIESEAMQGGEQALGACVATRPGKLSAKWVLHAVSAWNEVSCVGRALIRALLLADELGCSSLAIPALGTGAGLISMEMCANAMITAMRWHAMLGGTRLRHVTIYFDEPTKLATFREVAEAALRSEGDGAAKPDLGLSVEDKTVKPDGATCIDTSRPESVPPLQEIKR